MPVVSTLKAKLVWLQHTRLRWLLAATSSAWLSVKRRTPILIYPDKEGYWVNRQLGTIFYNRSYSNVSPDEILSKLFDIWCYRCRIKAGDTVVDIGAGVGDEAVIVSRIVGPAGKVIAIEANPKTFRCLEKTIAANKLRNTIIVHAAVCDNIGEVFIEDDENHQSNRMGCGTGERVTATTLDRILLDLDTTRPNFVKINVEGAETAVLRGASRTLGSVANWVVSCHDFMAHQPGYESSATYSGVTDILRKAGLDILPARVDARPWVPFYVYANRL
jgi:FkbM family methyltransferase